MQRDYTRKPFSRYEKNTLTRFICVLLTVTLVLSQAGYTQIYADISSNDSAGYTQEVSESDPENVTDSTEYSADTDASGNTSAADTDASVDTTIKVKSSYSFSEDDLYTTVSLKSSNKSIRVSWSLEKNVFSFSFYGSGSTKLTITLNGKKFTIAVTLKSIYASTDAVLLYPGKTKKKVKAIQKAIKIYKNSTYSQAKRMKSGYYDCSSLV